MACPPALFPTHDDAGGHPPSHDVAATAMSPKDDTSSVYGDRFSSYGTETGLGTGAGTGSSTMTGAPRTSALSARSDVGSGTFWSNATMTGASSPAAGIGRALESKTSSPTDAGGPSSGTPNSSPQSMPGRASLRLTASSSGATRSS